MNKYETRLLRIGPHHFAYLRCVAEGISIFEAARRYLAIGHAREAVTAHQRVVDTVRALARRRGDSRWRLIGIEVQDRTRPHAPPPPLLAWAESEGLGDWSEAELLALYEERFGSADPSARRRVARNARLRARRVELLRELELIAAERPAPLDLIEGWLPPLLVEQFHLIGIRMLGELAQRIAQGGCWWRDLETIGTTKAERIERLVEALLGPSAIARAWPVALARSEMQRLDGQHGVNRLRNGGPAIDATDDRQAIRAWIAARAGSAHTAKQYEREAERFLLWCVLERQKALSDASVEDCRAYLDFLSDLPARWISRHKVARLAPGWAPFRGPLSKASQNVAVEIVRSLFNWLVQARYLASNPWVLVNTKLGDDLDSVLGFDSSSRAFSKTAWKALHECLRHSPDTPANYRLRWLCTYIESTGLRASEILAARREHLTQFPKGWVQKVLGKGRKARVVPVPQVAIEATRHYFERRGLDFDRAAPEMPLLASTVDPLSPITYSSLAESFKRFVVRALEQSSLNHHEREHAMRASTHWLRHTHATRAAERGVPPDVLQENLGQSDPRTTAKYYRAQIERRQKAMEDAFGSAAIVDRA